MTPAAIVSKLWNYCNVLRDDGMSYGDYVEQLTYLLFLKMADERRSPPYNQPSAVPAVSDNRNEDDSDNGVLGVDYKRAHRGIEYLAAGRKATFS